MATLKRKQINTQNAPINPAMPYSQAVVLDNTIYVSGVLGVNKDTMKLVDDTFTSEVRQALKNLKAILEAGSSSLDKVVKVTVFLSDINDFAAMNEVYREFFTKDFPARTISVAAKLPLNASVVIEAIGATGTVKTICCH